MSYCGAVPVESESHILVEACLASVRAEARLDDEPVLPPLHVLLDSNRASTRFLVGSSTQHLPTPEAIVKSVWRVNRASVVDCTANVAPLSRPHADVRSSSRRDVSTDRKPKSLARRMRWPVFLCGFVAGIFGGMALMKSPIGKTPAVQRVLKSTHRHASSAYAATAAAKSHFGGR
jgi:hypothetical protein